MARHFTKSQPIGKILCGIIVRKPAASRSAYQRGLADTFYTGPTANLILFPRDQDQMTPNLAQIDGRREADTSMSGPT